MRSNSEVVREFLEKRGYRLNPAFWYGFTKHYGDRVPAFMVPSHVGRVPRALTDVQRRGGRGTP